MEKAELLERYEAGDLDNVTTLRSFRDDIRRHTDLEVPRRVGEAEQWWSRNKSVVARRLRGDSEADEETGADDDEETEDTE